MGWKLMLLHPNDNKGRECWKVIGLFILEFIHFGLWSWLIIVGWWKSKSPWNLEQDQNIISPSLVHHQHFLTISFKSVDNVWLYLGKSQTEVKMSPTELKLCVWEEGQRHVCVCDDAEVDLTFPIYLLGNLQLFPLMTQMHNSLIISSP